MQEQVNVPGPVEVHVDPVVAQLLVPPAAQLLIAVQYELKERTERKKEIEKEKKNLCKLCQCHCIRCCTCSCMFQDQYRCMWIQSWRSCLSHQSRNYWKLSKPKDDVGLVIQKKTKDGGYLTSTRGSRNKISCIASTCVASSAGIGAICIRTAGIGRARIVKNSACGPRPTRGTGARVLALTPSSGLASSVSPTRGSYASVCTQERVSKGEGKRRKKNPL